MGIPYNEKTQIMNKFLYVASAVALLCSCSNEIVQEEKSDHARTIQFDTYVAGQTRSIAYEATLDTIGNNGFQVYAFYSDTQLKYFSSLYQNIGGIISSKEENVWPTTGTLDFLAVYPNEKVTVKETVETGAAEGPFTGTIEVSPIGIIDGSEKKPDGVYDVMIATAANKKQADGSVALSFNHLLVKVQANIYYDSYYIDPYSNEGPALLSITLTGATAGDYDVKNQKWSVAADATSGSTTYSLFNTTESDYFGSSESQPVYEYTTKDSDHPIRASLMLIPAKYTLTVKHNRGDAITSEVDLSDKELDGGEVSSFAGKVVTLNIHISDNHIQFATPTVESWETGDAIPVD